MRTKVDTAQLVLLNGAVHTERALQPWADAPATPGVVFGDAIELCADKREPKARAGAQQRLCRAQRCCADRGVARGVRWE